MHVNPATLTDGEVRVALVQKAQAITAQAQATTAQTTKVGTPIGDNIRAERVYRDCPIIVLDRVTYTYLIELTILDFDIILGMDWLHKLYATIDCRNKIVTLLKNSEYGHKN